MSGRVGLTPTGVLSLPILRKPRPGGHPESEHFSLGAEATMFPFPYAQKPHGSKAPPSHSILATAHHDRTGSSAWPLAWLLVLAATVASGRGDRKQAFSARRQRGCQALN